jgi:hypothetical protein
MYVRRAIWLGLILTAGLLVAGCEEQENEPADYGQVRLSNESAGAVHLFIGEEPFLTAQPGKTAKKRVGEEAQGISVRDDAGNVLFSQVAVIPDNTFARYVVTADGNVYATAGNIEYPDIVGGRAERIDVLNGAPFDVELRANGVLMSHVRAGTRSTVDVPRAMLNVQIRRRGGRVLFEQAIDIPRNAVISYMVYADGSVIATGEEIGTNWYEKRYDGPYGSGYYYVPG